MISSNYYAGFLRDKQRFFTVVKSAQDAKDFVNDREHNFSFLQQNQVIIEKEFNHLFEILKKNDKDKEGFWLYCFYCCKLLETYYADIAYNKPERAKEYADLSYTIEEKHIKQNAQQDEQAEEKFLSFLQKQIAKDLSAIASTPLHTSKIRTNLGMANLYRLLLLFSRITVRQILLLAQELKLLNNTDRLIEKLNSLTKVFNILSVGLFLGRFILNVGLLVKHTFAPTDEEETVDKWDRFLHELFRRHYQFGNDVAWTVINLLANYADLFNISAAVANWLTAGFLIFDVLMLVIDNILAEREYKIKKAQYFRELSKLKESDLSAALKQQQFEMLKEQLQQLEIEWQTTNAYYKFNISAALLLMASFTAPLILTATLAATISYTLCTIAIAMYLTSDDYKKYAKASATMQKLKEKNVPDEQMSDELAAVKKSYHEFLLSLFKASVMPMLMVAVFAVSWQAALLVGVGYLGYRYVSNAKDEHHAQLEASGFQP